MQIIPVFDIKGGILVHAVGGMRQNYQPLSTPLLPEPDPKKACATLVNLGFDRFYIADLDAITGDGNNYDIIQDLVEEYQVSVWLDAGLSSSGHLPLLALPQVSLVLGSETLARFDYLFDICQQTGKDRLIFSLDTKDGILLTPDPELKGKDPADIAAKMFKAGIKELIVLDLKAVGSEGGLNKKLLQGLINKVPKARIFPGGGLTPQDIKELKEMKIPGVLTATALYSKQIKAKPEL
ncbi:MAG: HisA/HisF-related TIM barrel protein [Syntrophaceticus sp.]|jgi:phosphoribosylformimino-5-aminoimidazole carboxamide ribotide isomerase